jgi:RHS repeat-associated protein
VNSVSYSYDQAGNVTNDGALTYGYDAENRLVSVDGGATATYIYDDANRRLRKPGIHYVWEGYQVAAEHNSSSGAVIVDYVHHGGQLIANATNGSFFLRDRLSIRATITDGQGGIQGVQTHLPFGEDLVASGQQAKYRFTSYERDTETNTDYAVNRHYTIAPGRFLSPDIYRASYRFRLPQTWNRYGYALQDSTNRIDPLGLDCSDLDSFEIDGDSEGESGDDKTSVEDPGDVHGGSTVNPTDPSLIDRLFGTGFSCRQGGGGGSAQDRECLNRVFEQCLNEKLPTGGMMPSDVPGGWDPVFTAEAVFCFLTCLAALNPNPLQPLVAACLPVDGAA